MKDKDMTNVDIGRFGEQAVCDYLVNNGYNIILRNFRNRYGEIDIIAENQEVLAFIEVKTRRAGTILAPRIAVNNKKQKTIIIVASMFLQQYLDGKICEKSISLDIA